MDRRDSCLFDLTNLLRGTLAGRGRFDGRGIKVVSRALGEDGPSMSLPPFEQVVREEGPRVLRVCRAVVGPHDAEDAWSETFLSALSAYPRLAPGSNVRGWLVTIAHRKAIDRLRARRRGPVAMGDFPEPPATGTEPHDPDTALWAALATLPDKQRRAVAYHYIADLPYAAVADLLGTSQAAARRAAADGVSALRRRMGMGVQQ